MTGWGTPRSVENGHSTGNSSRATDGLSRLEDQVKWINVKYIQCADGKARPVEPGIHPLARWGSRPSGTPARLRERDSTPSVAAKFIEASMEAII